MAKIVNTCNFDLDYPYEEWVFPTINFREDEAKQICDILNRVANRGEIHPRYWKVVPDNYVLRDKGPLE